MNQNNETLDTTDLPSYYPGYDEYCEKQLSIDDYEEDVDAINDDRAIEEHFKNEKEEY